MVLLLIGFAAVPVFADVSGAELGAAVDYKLELLINNRIHLEQSIKELRNILENRVTTPIAGNDPASLVFLKHLDGNVLKVNKKWDFVLIDLGMKNKITVGDENPREITVALPEKLTMNVIRGKKFIGTVTVTKVNDKTAICDIASVAAGRQILPGDRVLFAEPAEQIED